MKFLVAIKINDYCEEFSFETSKERDSFISTTQMMNPAVEIITTEVKVEIHERLTA